MEQMERFVEKARKIIIAYAVAIAAMVIILIGMLVLKVRMLTVIGVLLGFIVAVVCFTISGYFEESGKETVIKAIVTGVLFALIYATVGKSPAWLAMIMFIISLGMMGYLVYWWYQEGSTVKELVAMSLLDLLIVWCLAVPAAVAGIYDITQVGWVRALIVSIPKMMFFVSVGYFVANMIWFKQEINSLEGGE